MKSLMLFLRSVLDDMGARCDTSTQRDFEEVTLRVKHEGLSFLTITLADFDKDFTKALDQGFVDPTLFRSFRKRGSLPVFLRGFFDLVFDRSTGTLLQNPSIDAIFCIHQFSQMFKKIGLPCSERRTKMALQQYIDTEKVLSELHFGDTDLSGLRQAVSVLFRDVLTVIDRKIFTYDIRPKHGPGATAEKLTSNGKYNLSYWPHRLDSVFPYTEYAIPNYGYHSDSHIAQEEDPGTEIPVRVITVPKTLKTPRIIAIEPTCMQYMQQAILEPLVQGLESDSVCSPFIGFSEQEPNKALARMGSLTGDLATLDLSEASDRVSNQLVQACFENFPHFSDGLSATRSRQADVPGYGIHTLSKFASMGSALCFPIEAMVFLAIIFFTISKELNVPLTRDLVKRYRGKVRVYGDDIIIPVEFVFSCSKNLELFGFKVNSTKSFWTGKFRESCGGDYYAGNDITTVKVRSNFPRSKKNVQELVSTVSLRNHLYEIGFWKTTAFLDNLIEKIIPFPAVEHTSPILGKWSFLAKPDYPLRGRYQLPLVRGAYLSQHIPSDSLEGYGALMKFFLKRGDEPIFSKDHLERSGRPNQSHIKIRWMCSY